MGDGETICEKDVQGISSNQPLQEGWERCDDPRGGGVKGSLKKRPKPGEGGRKTQEKRPKIGNLT